MPTASGCRLYIRSIVFCRQNSLCPKFGFTNRLYINIESHSTKNLVIVGCYYTRVLQVVYYEGSQESKINFERMKYEMRCIEIGLYSTIRVIETGV